MTPKEHHRFGVLLPFFQVVYKTPPILVKTPQVNDMVSSHFAECGKLGVARPGSAARVRSLPKGELTDCG